MLRLAQKKKLRYESSKDLLGLVMSDPIQHECTFFTGFSERAALKAQIIVLVKISLGDAK